MDPSEVLSYLNLLGYKNISAIQLKEFITDLKKLLKYEIRHSIQEESPEVQNYTNGYSKNQQSVDQNEIENIFNQLYRQTTVSSQGKRVVPKQQKQITLHITKKRSKNIAHEHCMHIDENLLNGENLKQSELTVSARTSRVEVESTKTSRVDTESSDKITGVSTKESTKSSTSNTRIKKPCQCNSKHHINRCDPVALFHYYQSEWKKQKIPGKDNHDDIRWAVREKLLEGPPTEIPLTNKTSCRKTSIITNPFIP